MGSYARGKAALVGCLPYDRGGPRARRECSCGRRIGFGPAHLDRDRRRGRERRGDRHTGCDRHAEGGRQRRGCGGRRGWRPWRDRAVFVRHRRRGLHGRPHRRGSCDHDRRPRDRAQGDDADFILGRKPARTAAVQRCAVQRSLGGCSRHRRHMGGSAREVRDDDACAGTSAGRPRRQPRLCRRSDLLRPDAAERRLLQRRSGDHGAVPRFRRHPARRRQRLHQPGACGDVSTDRAPRAERLLPWGGGGRDRRHRSGSGHLVHREPHVAARRDGYARPAGVRRAKARADARQPTTASTCTRWARRRAAARRSARR